MSDNQKPAKQTDEQRKELRELATKAEGLSDRLAKHGIHFGVHYQRNALQQDGSTSDGLGIKRSINAEVSLMEMMADWYDAREKAIESGEFGRFMGEVLELQGGKAN